MTYDDAMDWLHAHQGKHCSLQCVKGPLNRLVTRPGLPGLGVGRPFGEVVILIGPGEQISYTPTYEDMYATDWAIADERLDG